MISIITATQDHNEILNVELLQYELKDRIMLWLMMVVGVGGASYDLDQIDRFMHICMYEILLTYSLIKETPELISPSPSFPPLVTCSPGSEKKYERCFSTLTTGFNERI